MEKIHKNQQFPHTKFNPSKFRVIPIGINSTIEAINIVDQTGKEYFVKVPWTNILCSERGYSLKNISITDDKGTTNLHNCFVKTNRQHKAEVGATGEFCQGHDKFEIINIAAVLCKRYLAPQIGKSTTTQERIEREMTKKYFTKSPGMIASGGEELWTLIDDYTKENLRETYASTVFDEIQKKSNLLCHIQEGPTRDRLKTRIMNFVEIVQDTQDLKEYANNASNFTYQGFSWTDKSTHREHVSFIYSKKRELLEVSSKQTSYLSAYVD